MNTSQFMPEGWTQTCVTINKNKIQEYIQTREILQGKVKKCDENYNLHVSLGNGIEGIVPREEVEGINIEEDGYPKINLCTGKVNKFIQFKVKELQNDNIAILSRKEVQEEALDWIKNNLQLGEQITGIVKNIRPYGAFIEIGGGIVGLAHIEDLSVARIKSPSERLEIGQKVNVVVKSIDRDTGRVILSYKELLGTWEENIKDFESGMKTKGIVRETEKNKNGIFIELKPNLVGMAEFKEGIEYGQKVNVYIKKIDFDKKKVKLLII